MNSGRWRSEEDVELIKMMSEDFFYQEAAQALDRSKRAVKRRVERLRNKGIHVPGLFR